MKAYNVTIECTVTVYAKTAEEARERAEDGDGEQMRRVWVLEVEEDGDE